MKQRTMNKKQRTENIEHSNQCSMFNAPCSLTGGFSFIETLVAIGILLLAITAPLTLASQGLVASRISRDTTVATYLAQEGIEYIHNLRDSNALSGNGWLEGLEDCIDLPCALDTSEGEFVTCDDKDTCPVLNFNENTGAYGISGDKGLEETKFTRRLTVETIGGSEVGVVVDIFWEDGLRERSLTLQERMFDWP